MIYIHGCGHFHPETVIDNEFLEELDIGCDTAWTLERVGIATRRTVLPLDYIRQTKNNDVAAAHEASIYSNAETGAKAAEMAIEKAGISKNDIGLVISGSCSPQHCVPAEACTIAAKLEIEATAFDINSACTSFLAQLNYLNSVKPETLPDYVLIVCPENNTRVIDYSDRTAAVLWGDGSAAMVVSTKLDSPVSISKCILSSAASKWENIRVPPMGHFTQIGRTVQTYAIKKSLSTIQKLREEISPERGSKLKFVGHQANLMMLNSVGRLAEISTENHLYNVNSVGNCGAAGAPSVLSQNWEKLQPGDHIILAIVGAGLTWGGALIKVRETV